MLFSTNIKVLDVWSQPCMTLTAYCFAQKAYISLVQDEPIDQQNMNPLYILVGVFSPKDGFPV